MSMSYIATSKLVSTVPVSCHCQVTPGFGIQKALSVVALAFAAGGGAAAGALAAGLLELAAAAGGFTPELPVPMELGQLGSLPAALGLGAALRVMLAAPAAPLPAAGTAGEPAFAAGMLDVDLTPLAEPLPRGTSASPGAHPTLESVAKKKPTVQ